MNPSTLRGHVIHIPGVVFKPDAIIQVEVRPDGSIVLAEWGKLPLQAHPGVNCEIQAACTYGIRTACSERVEIKAAADGAAAGVRPFQMTAYTGAAMRLQGYYRPVVIDLSGMRVAAKSIPILRSHEPDRIVGHSEDVEISAQRLRASGLLSGVGPDTEEVLKLSDRGFPWQASVGASVERMEFVDAGASVKVNGRNFDGPILVARQTTLGEISFVPLGADPSTASKVGQEK